MLRAYLPPLIMAALISGGLTFYIKTLAEKFKIFDIPSPRKIHQKPIPRLGGAAIIISFIVVIIAYSLASHRLEFSSFKFFLIDKRILGVLAGLLVIAITGIIDDIRGIGPFKKLFWQIVASGFVVAGGLSINFLRLPFGLHLDLSNLQFPLHLFGATFT